MIRHRTSALSQWIEVRRRRRIFMILGIFAYHPRVAQTVVGIAALFRYSPKTVSKDFAWLEGNGYVTSSRAQYSHDTLYWRSEQAAAAEEGQEQ